MSILRGISLTIKLIIGIAVIVAFYELVTEEKDPSKDWYQEPCWAVKTKLYSTEDGKLYSEIYNGYDGEILVSYSVHMDTIKVFRMVKIDSDKTTGPIEIDLPEENSWLEVNGVFNTDGSLLECEKVD
jgi:hypothetical protein